MKKYLFYVSLLVIFACGDNGLPKPRQGCLWHYFYADQFSYKITPSFETETQIAVDTEGQIISGELIDRLADEVENCLTDTFGDPPVLPPDVVRDSQCASSTFELPIARQCLTVKIPSDWHLNCAGDQQVLPARASEAACTSKGLQPTPECPCHWRAGIENFTTIVTTPSFYLFKDPLIRIATGCNNPWGSPALAACARPSTDPLSLGRDETEVGR